MVADVVDKYYSVICGKSRPASRPPRRHHARAVTCTSPGPGGLQSQPNPVSAGPVATTFAQHVNTVRGHLDALVVDGLALRHRQGTSGRGRPAWYYQANPQRPEPDARVREHGALAGALAAHLIRTSPTPADEARAAGIEWGSQIARDRDTGPTSPTNPTAHARREVLRPSTTWVRPR